MNTLLLFSPAMLVPIAELIEEFKIYFLFFYRPGNGESDPDPSRSMKSEAYDVQELADKLQIGPKFNVVRSCPGSSICALLVALSSCQFINRSLKEAASGSPNDVSRCSSHPLAILLVDDSRMVSIDE
ncbi:hypothetical protein Ddye_022476 [Dipteronia dyeriana]|uniref:Uncharacterized protein n=1 Tax=Dipteronia dyeriana TaxID=168575 RepID=A0AAD9WSD9_9ROSI|nr:hypothetical protein Ddye_022476 [Dipteronia dyeriana]